MSEFQLTQAQREALQSFLDTPPATREEHDTLTQYLKDIAMECKPKYALHMCMKWEDMRLLDRVSEVHMNVELEFEDEDAQRVLHAQLHAIHPLLGDLSRGIEL
jgi:hypothetical protein